MEMPVWFGAGLAVCAMVCAGVAGFFCWNAAEGIRRRVLHKRGVRLLAEGSSGAMERAGSSKGDHVSASSLDDRAIALATDMSRALSLGHGRRVVPDRLASEGWLSRHVLAAGLRDKVTAAGFWEARVRLAACGMALGVLAGCVASAELAVVLAVVGLFVGWRLLPRAIRRREERRAQEMERHLPEMLDVLSLGMRSGLSFDRSLLLYAQHFDTLLAREFYLAQQQWTHGFARRDDALRNVAASYDSPLLRRVIENMVRSLRFGSSLAESLEATSREARAGYRARKQEQVAKAPVKMMVPTGALILPAMLILVLGPVLLELMEGF